MGFLGSLFNGAQGAGFQAQSGQNLQQPFNQDQVLNQLGQTQGALGQQQALANALGQAGGIQNLNNSVNTLGTTANQIGGTVGQLAPGIAQTGNIAGQLQGLTGQYQNIANGGGPNPAQAMLAQSTGQNVANQGALAAGQRGAGGNIGLLERQAAMQGSNAQQNAAGQAAILQANQQMNALGQIGNSLGQQSGVLGQQGSLIGQQAGILGQAGQLQNAQGNLANQQVQNQMGGLGALTSANLQNQGQLTQGIGAQNTANIQNASQQNSANGAIAGQNAKAQSDLFGGLTNGLSSAAVMALAHGGQVENPKLAQVSRSDRFPKMMPSHLHDVANIYHDSNMPSYAYGGMTNGSMKQGGQVPGQAKMEGDHEANDTVPAKLSPGEVVIPRSVVESDDPVANAAKFMASVLKKDGKSNPEGDFKDALRRAVKNRKSK